MEDAGAGIIAQLRTVVQERELRAAEPAFGARVLALKAFQHHRFARTYRDLMLSARYAAAASFFLEDLYGPEDFSERDRQFMRIVPAMVRLFPGEIVQTVSDIGALHALSERLDSAMARQLMAEDIDVKNYGRAWRTTSPDDRETQIQLMLAVGSALDKYTRKPLLRQSLRLMRGPARAAGLGDLQRFLERGFDIFNGMGGADEFLATIGRRERQLAALLFSGSDLES